jgi:hypothetical protein
MGLAHALALPGCVDTVTDAFGPRPLLEAHQVAWLAVEPRVATGWEREQADRLSLHVTTSRALAADPAGAARAALDHLPPGPLALHIDVDVPDFIDARWRRTLTAATPDLPATRPCRRSRWQREIRRCERCRSENSTPPGAQATPMPFPDLPAASLAYSPPRFIRFAVAGRAAAARNGSTTCDDLTAALERLLSGSRAAGRA